jgi:DNA-directed RNA polymerase subunit RPC12/RpoP
MIKYKTNINGRKRTVYTGPKGGKYYMKGGKKLYVNHVMKGGARYYLEEGKFLANGRNEILTFDDFLSHSKLKEYIRENYVPNLNVIQELRKITSKDTPKLYTEIEKICNITFDKEFHVKRLIRFAKEVVIVCEEQEHNLVEHYTASTGMHYGKNGYSCSICGTEFDKNTYNNIVKKQSDKKQSECTEHNLVKHDPNNSAGLNAQFSYSCSICGTKFDKKTYNNIVKKQSDNIQSKCNGHIYTVITANGLSQVSCEKCGKTVNTKNQEYINYKKKITNSCEHSFSDGISQNHLLNENEPPITSYKCNKCNSYFENTSNEYLRYKNVNNALKLKR